MDTIGIVVGNPKARSRTLEVAHAVATAAAGAVCVADADRLVVDLADLGPVLFDWSSGRVREAVAAIASCRLVVVASPTYKASYTGLLKSFLDWFCTTGLRGVVVVPVMVGGSLLRGRRRGPSAPGAGGDRGDGADPWSVRDRGAAGRAGGRDRRLVGRCGAAVAWRRRGDPALSRLSALVPTWLESNIIVWQEGRSRVAWHPGGPPVSSGHCSPGDHSGDACRHGRAAR